MLGSEAVLPVGNEELSVLKALEERGDLDVLEIASAARLPPSVVAEAIARLKERGLVDVVGERGGRERLAINRAALRRRYLAG